MTPRLIMPSARGAWRKIKDAMLTERSTIVDGHGNGPTALRIAHANARAKRQCPMRRGHAIAVRGVKGTQS